MGLRDRFQREPRIAHADDPKANGETTQANASRDTERTATNGHGNGNGNGNGSYLPTHNNEKPTTRGIQPAGESGRRGVHRKPTFDLPIDTPHPFLNPRQLTW